MMVILALIILCVFLYWLGGQEFAHTLFRDIGCTVCIFCLALVLLGWHWSLLGMALMPIGFSIGDHENFYWTAHAFVIGMSMLLATVVMSAWFAFIPMMIVVVGGTYLVSRFWNRWGVDVLGRGLLYATIPVWFYFLCN